MQTEFNQVRRFAQQMGQEITDRFGGSIELETQFDQSFTVVPFIRWTGDDRAVRMPVDRNLLRAEGPSAAIISALREVQKTLRQAANEPWG